MEKPTLNFSEAISLAGSRILQFSGRSRRSEYWWTMLLVYACNMVLTPLIGFILYMLTIPLTFRRLHDTGHSGWWIGVGFLASAAEFAYLVYNIVIMLFYPVSFDVYDADFNPIYNALNIIVQHLIFLLFIVIYHIVLIVFLCKDSDPNENKYGLSPKYTSTAD